MIPVDLSPDTPAGAPDAPPGAPWFQAEIVPHRSLGQGGLRWVAGALCGLSACIGAGLWWLGAWPVIGFTGIEILLAVWLLQHHARRRGVTEQLVLSASGMRVIRLGPAGRTEQVLPLAWLRTVLEARPGRTPALLLRSGQRSIEVGNVLGEVEKRDLAAALDRALDRGWRPKSGG